MKLINLLPLNEESTGAFGATSEELADMYSLKMLQQMRDEVMMDMEQQAEPEGGPIADMYGGQLNGLDKAIAIKRGETKDVPYDVAIGRMTQDEYDKMMSTVKPDRASFEKSSKFDRMQEGMPTVFDDKSMEELGDIISKYVKDPDDVQRELDRFDDGGFDNMSNMVIANLLRDPEYKAWYNKLHSIKENNDVRKVIRKIIKEQNFDDRLKSMMGADDFEKATNPQLGKLISNSIATIDPEMSYVDFAKGVAQVLIDEYGTHNYEPFIKELKKALDSTLG